MLNHKELAHMGQFFFCLLILSTRAEKSETLDSLKIYYFGCSLFF